MDIRVLQQKELLPALHLVWEVFIREVAPSYTPEGVEEFQKFIKYESMAELYQKREITFFGAFEGSELCGTMAVKKTGHICLFYVKEGQQGKGIGRQLFHEVRQFVFLSLRVNKITVNAAPGAISKYETLGFQATAQEQVEKGMRFLPMELVINVKDIKQPASLHKGWIIAIIVAGVLLTCSLLVVGTVAIVGGVKGVTQRYDGYDRNFGDDLDEFGDRFDNKFGDGSTAIPDDEVQEASGIDAIEVYEADGLTYKVEEEVYKHEDSQNKNMTVQFEVRYPKISGLEAGIEEKVNQSLKDCAMKTVDAIYTNPSEEIKEGVLLAENPALISYVRYKVTSISQNFISVVYEDYSYQGSVELPVTNLRTQNVSLVDGSIYEVKDIVTMNDSFLEKVRAGLQDEAQNDKLLSELSKDDMKKTLEGNTSEGVYVPNFFVDADGIEIGYDLNYKKEDTNDQGYIWVTAPFGLDEIKPYQSDSKMWNEIR